jgi:hypothetical protein
MIHAGHPVFDAIVLILSNILTGNENRSLKSSLSERRPRARIDASAPASKPRGPIRSSPMILLSIAGLLMLSVTLARGWHPSPFGKRAFRRGPDSGSYWFAVGIEIVLIVLGLVSYFSN